MTQILLNILKEAQDKEGHLSEKTLKKLSIKHNVPISQLYGVATFYMMLKTKEQGKHIIEICGSPSCVLNDSTTVEKFLERELNIRIGETTKDKKFSLYKSSCIGCCDEAPAMLIDGKPHTKLTVSKIKEIIAKLGKE